MKRRFIATIMVFCLVFSLFTVTSNAASKKKKAKYVKIKKATYQTYKKAYNENKSLKNQLASKNSTLNAIKKQLDEKNAALESANSMNKWVWSNINSMGIDYEKKTWTIPKGMPEKFVIDGVTYKVIREE